MRKFLKVLAYLVAALIGLAAIGYGAAYWKSNRVLAKTYAVSVTAPVWPTDSGAVTRGKHIAGTRGCMECHGADLAGAKVIDDPAMGKLYGPNITRGRGGLPADYRDEEYVRAIRHGVRRDGKGLVLMPSNDFSRFSDADLGDLVAYIKSVPPVDRDSIPISLGPVARILVALGKITPAAAEIDHAHVTPNNVTPAVSVEYGRYLAVGCTGCHGSNFSGGKIEIGPPDWPLAANLTPHPSGRLARWSETEFMTTLRTGTRPDGTSVNPVMPRAFGQMNDTELKAIWAYLKTLPAAPIGAR